MTCYHCGKECTRNSSTQRYCKPCRKEVTRGLSSDYARTHRSKYARSAMHARHHYMFGGNRDLVLARDGERCVDCGITRAEHQEKYQRDITIHHIDGMGHNRPKEEKNNDPDNLVTLCLSCHSKRDLKDRLDKEGYPDSRHAKKCPRRRGMKCTCDRFHTFDELYDHRIALWIAVCKLARTEAWRSQLHSDGTSYKDWFILGMFKEPGRQLTYHLPMDKWEETSFAETLERAPEFDGHTSDDVVARIKKLEQALEEKK